MAPALRGKRRERLEILAVFPFILPKTWVRLEMGGGIVTNDKKIAEDVKVFRNYGSEKRYYNRVVGANSRLDEIQAGLLRVRLSHLKELEDDKRRICIRYLQEIKNDNIRLPEVRDGATHIWHQFVIRTDRRDKLMEYLAEKEIGTIIHYPIPPHLSEAYQYLGIPKGSLPITEKYAESVLSIPLYNGMTDDEQSYVIAALNQFKL